MAEQLHGMIKQAGGPAGYEATGWILEWIMAPLPALGGATPASYMSTVEGRAQIADLLAMSLSDVYA